MDTSKSKKEPWVEYFDSGLLGLEVCTGGVVYEVNLKLRPAGMLAIIKVRGPDGYYVGFVGAGGLASLLRGVRDKVAGSDTRWRADKYRPT